MQFSTLIKFLLIAQHLGVQSNDVTELMNTTDLGSIDATKWAATFNQSSETVAAWSPIIKNRMLSMMHILLNFESTEENTQEKRLNLAQRVGNLDVIRAETDLKVQLLDDEQQDKKSCLWQITCVTCVSAAVAATTDPIATCASTAYVTIGQLRLKLQEPSFRPSSWLLLDVLRLIVLRLTCEFSGDFADKPGGVQGSSFKEALNMNFWVDSRSC
ncbi:hypothetical protein BOTNAR_2704g00010 [Botryotinia narcissicola]|uniref:Uncharacterized protein n=1 Tax=Botryotinia narcissicola TaxID=278944 RepID=A0A4Z1H3I9_9HELO|nr:hypothetical protein BOTNAR_2704g00010 [Botryotinia narcissicola]